MKSNNLKVAIIGAGAAGLTAAYLLQQKEITYTIFEASAIAGGRIRSLTGFADFPIELGAEEIHGQNSWLYELSEKLGKDTYRLKGDDLYFIDGKTYTGDRLWKIEAETMQKIDDFMLNIEDYEGEDISIQKLVEQHKIPEKFQFILDIWLGNEYGSCNKRLGAKSLAEAEQKWTSGSKNFHFRGERYLSVFEEIFSDVFQHIQYNTPIQKIDYQTNKVKLISEQGISYEADKVIVTIPINILKAQDIDFIPSLPVSKLKAIQNIGMDNAIKVILKFKQRIWEESLSSIFSDGIVPEYWMPGWRNVGQNNVMIGLVAGEKAEKLAKLGEEAKSKILEELDIIFGNQLASQNLENYLLQDWGKEPYIRGGYSYPSLGSDEARKRLASPIANKLFFAGEATHTAGHLATVHGAMETAERAVEEILKNYQ